LNLADAQITLVGLGLMGGSLAMRLKTDRRCKRIVALLRREEAVQEAQALGVVDWATTDASAALKEADIVILATPVRVLMEQLQHYRPFFKPGAVVTDLGSTKREITHVLAQLAPQVYPVGSHPMCGKEVAGLAVAEPSLYNQATWVISPLPDTPASIIAVIDELARSVGAKPLLLPPDRHDYLVAAISHLPYLLSSALVLAAQSVAETDEQVWQVAASGFKDTSRLAASNVAMMMDILLTNQDAVGSMLDRFRGQLDALAEAIATGDETTLQRLLEQARDQRKTLYP